MSDYEASFGCRPEEPVVVGDELVRGDPQRARQVDRVERANLV